MGLDIYFRDDLGHIFDALAGNAEVMPDPYRLGYLRALYDMGLAIGIPRPEPKLRHTLPYIDTVELGRGEC